MSVIIDVLIALAIWEVIKAIVNWKSYPQKIIHKKNRKSFSERMNENIEPNGNK